MRIISLMVGLLAFQTLFAEAILIEEKEVTSPYSSRGMTTDKKPQTRIEVKEGSFFSERTKFSEAQANLEYDSALSMRSQRRVGVGTQIAGQLGMLGLLLELNIMPEDAAVIGFGGGPKYGSLTFQWKHVFGGGTVSPYFTAGYARWYSSNKGPTTIGDTNPGFLGTKFLTDDEKKTGNFAKDLMIPSLGLQFNNLRGKFAGTTLFAEVMMIVNLSQLDQVPTGTMGMLYYF